MLDHVASRQTSIRARLAGIVLLTGGLALLMAGASFTAYDLATYARFRAAELGTEAEILGSLSAAALDFDDTEAATEYLGTLRRVDSVVEAVTYDADGRVFASYRRDPGAARDAPAPERDGHRVESDDLLVFRDIARDGKRLGTIHLRSDLGLRDRVLRYGGIVLGVSLASLALATLLLARMQAAVVEPLLEVTRVARKVIDERDYTQRVAGTSRDEVGVLVQAFNQMLDGIEDRERSLQAAAVELERRVAERTAELQAANKELESFSYSVSHDLRAPLRSIDGFTSILQTRYAAALDEKGREYMDRVRAAAQRMGHLIDDLLKLSRTVRAEMARQEVDLSAMASAVVQELRAGSPDRTVDVRIEPGLAVNADPDLMRTVLENLIGNAWKFTARTPQARIEVGAMNTEAGRAVLVRDNGAGFDMKYAGKLFGAFQRLHASADYDGTGVGLANVHRIVQRHGGRVWAESEIGRGATFYFTLG